MEDQVVDYETLHEQAKFALGVTNSVLWTLDLDTSETTTVVGPVESLFNVEHGNRGFEAFVAEAVHPADAAEVRRVYESVSRGETEQFRVEFRTHPENGDVRWTESRGEVHGDDGRLLVGITTDITSYKRREQELAEQNARLEEFAGVLSHDLRNPLSVADGHIELARAERDSEHLDAAACAVDRIDELVDDLLETVRADAPDARQGGEPRTLSTVEVAAVADECWANVDTGTASLRVPADGEVDADRSRLKRVFENLFTNAVEHGGSEVTVTVGDLDADGGFYVADDGRGIPDAARERVFESGYSTAADGVGLGLHIVREIAAAHGWQVAVTDSATGGTRFEVRTDG